MKLELVIFAITTFLIYNSYHDGKYSKMIMHYKKYYNMAFIGFVALSLYLMIKRNPLQSKNMLLYANNMVKYMPIDKSSMDMISPIFDLSSGGSKSFMEKMNSTTNPGHNYAPVLQQQQQRTVLSGQKATKRSVSETKKKYVASMQDWKCAQCNNKLNHTFEIDHKIRLEYGGGNDVANLVALCRECHGQKTSMENM
jgi:hypothetical protein